MNPFNQRQVTFICLEKENSKLVELESLLTAGQDIDLGESKLLLDCKFQLYAGTAVNNKQVTTSRMNS